MQVNIIKTKKEWEGFLLQCQQKTFLDSWHWGEFQIALGKQIWRLGIFDGTKLLAIALVVKYQARRGSFLLVPHGPVIQLQRSPVPVAEILQSLVQKLKDLSKEEGVDFIRVSPILERTPEYEAIFRNLGFRLRPMHMHPESSWKLNIELTEDKLFSGMRKTTRYLIRQAQKDKNLEIYQSFNIKDVEVFNQMHLEVVKNQKFVPFSLEYFKKEFLAFLPDNEIALFLAKYKGQVIAASYGIFWSGMAFYHHAALLPQYKKVPAAYLLQWTAIQEAKKRGCKIYDFWGYSDPVKYPKHPYSGPTLFKMGFGGYKDEYVKTQDLVLTQRYWITYIIESIRRIKRGL